MKIEDPIREVHWSREEEIDYAKENGIPVPITKKSPYSIDENLWGRANECGILENPWNSAPEDAYARTNALEDTPNEADVITLTFENGVPVKLNDEALQLDVLIQKLDKLAGKHGIGRIDHVENRLVGIKSREVYECPAATVLMAAHKDIEDITLEKSLAHFKIYIEDKLADVIYNGLWFSPLMNSLLAFIKESQKTLTALCASSFSKATSFVKAESPLTRFTTKNSQHTLPQTNSIRKQPLDSSSFTACRHKFMLKFIKRVRNNEYEKTLGRTF